MSASLDCLVVDEESDIRRWLKDSTHETKSTGSV